VVALAITAPQHTVLDGYDATRQIKTARVCGNSDERGEFLRHEGGRGTARASGCEDLLRLLRRYLRETEER
jgi:hypothetical protein